MLTLIAILGGLWGGATLYDYTRSLIGCYGATIGLYAAALAFNAAMDRTPANAAASLRRSVAEFGTSLGALLKHPRLGRVLLGCGMFWFAGAVLRSNLQGWGLETLRAAGVVAIDNQRLAILKIGLILGVVAGSQLAGQLHRVGDLSWTRRYGVMMAGGVLLLGLLGGKFGVAVAALALVVTGVAAGLLLIPLNAALQHESDPTQLGKTIAVQNFVDYCSMLVGAAFLQLLTHFNFAPAQAFVALAAALAVLAVALRLPRLLTSAPSSPS
jgi:LPLT family lysophospholipid transporter-like MFS transporter